MKTTCFTRSRNVIDRLFAISLATAISVLSVSCLPPGDNVEVETIYGTLVGKDHEGTKKFFGIPYAKPPVDNLRWEPPQPPDSWLGKRNAFVQPKACVQGATPTGAFGSQEDCLYLDVWAPSTEGPHPVMLWIHGGAFQIGSANEMEYDGAILALEQDVIVITINYRLSYLGFLAFPQMPGSASHTIAGNQGILDQIAALEWVQDNIGAFGGDPDNVTIFGVSAGSISGCYLLASPLIDDLFHQVIMESGACNYYQTHTTEDAEAQGLDLLEATGCAAEADPIQCARDLSPKQIQAALGPLLNIFSVMGGEDFFSLPWPAIDGNLLPESPESLLENSIKDVSLLVGVTKDEGSLLTLTWEHPTDKADYVPYLDEHLGGFGEEASAFYPFEDFSPIGEAASQIGTDWFYICPSRAIADIWSETHPVYFYQFTQAVTAPIMEFLTLLFLTPHAADLGTFHASMDPYVFGYDSVLGQAATPDQQSMRADIMSYWGNFARTGNPNGTGLNTWPPYTAEQPDYLVLEADPQPATALRQEYCDYMWGSMEGM